MRASILSLHHRRSISRVLGLAVAVTVFVQLPLAAAKDIAPLLEEIREKRKLPALAAAAIKDGKLVAVGATGLRRLGGTELVTVDDKWHLGSCTKSMTAGVAAMLVQKGAMKWEQTVGETLASRCPNMDAAWRDVTLEQLFSHRAGAPPKAPRDLWSEAWKRIGTPSDQRWEFTRGLLKSPPVHPPGTKYDYSNQGYTIAGQMMELAVKKPWEEFMQEMLFEPLGLRSAGFGAPGDAEKVDQPWGHHDGKPIPPGPRADNPAAIGPGGIVHMSISDFARYAAWHAARKELLPMEQFAKLHTPASGFDYALGLHVTKRPWGNGTVLNHNGTNTMNFAVMWIAPERNFAVVAATNIWGKDADRGCDDACAQLIKLVLSPEE